MASWSRARTRRVAAWKAVAPENVELPFLPARVILQHFTGVPAVVDLASITTRAAPLPGV